MQPVPAHSTKRRLIPVAVGSHEGRRIQALVRALHGAQKVEVVILRRNRKLSANEVRGRYILRRAAQSARKCDKRKAVLHDRVVIPIDQRPAALERRNLFSVLV